jgi:hypothetical protein
MVGDGVIAESYVSFEITWKNPGSGQQPIWDQNNQKSELHTIDIYPDLLYTKASALATYYKYTSIDKILGLAREIDEVIDLEIREMLRKAKTNEALLLPAGEEPGTNSPAAVQKSGETGLVTMTKKEDTVSSNEPDKSQVDSTKKDEVTVAKAEEDESTNTGDETFAYTVKVVADRLRFIDIQAGGYSGSEVLITHRASNNMVKQAEEDSDNSNRILAIVEVGGTIFKDIIRLDYSKFDMPDGRNLLVEILPSIELRFTAGEPAVAPRPESTRDEDRWVIEYAKMKRRFEKMVLAANKEAKEEADEINKQKK